MKKALNCFMGMLIILSGLVSEAHCFCSYTKTNAANRLASEKVYKRETQIIHDESMDTGLAAERCLDFVNNRNANRNHQLYDGSKLAYQGVRCVAGKGKGYVARTATETWNNAKNDFGSR